MTISRRQFMHSTAAAAAAITFLPYAARAAGHSSDVFETPADNITVHPIAHASFIMETPAGTICNDPVGDAAQYANLPAPDLILVTHEHPDHFSAETLTALTGIDVAFVCMNLPFTMDVKAAASAVSEFKPKYVYPYHYRGRDNGTQDPAEFVKLLQGETEPKMGD